jgi:hypothetical protein
MTARRSDTPMAKVADLQPGDLVDNGLWAALYMGAADDPLDETRRLVIWAHPGGRWSVAALRPDAEAGEVAAVSGEIRAARIGEVLEHGGRGGLI